MNKCTSLSVFYQLDVGTVYAQPDHRFCRRWAVLTDPEETLGASGAGIKVRFNDLILCVTKKVSNSLCINTLNSEKLVNRGLGLVPRAFWWVFLKGTEEVIVEGSIKPGSQPNF